MEGSSTKLRKGFGNGSHEEEVDQLRDLELPLGSEENEEQMENGRASQVRPLTNYSPFSYPISLNRKGEKVRAKMDKNPREKREAREGKRLVDLAGWKLQFVVFSQPHARDM